MPEFKNPDLPSPPDSGGEPGGDGGDDKSTSGLEAAERMESEDGTATTAEQVRGEVPGSDRDRDSESAGTGDPDKATPSEEGAENPLHHAPEAGHYGESLEHAAEAIGEKHEADEESRADGETQAGEQRNIGKEIGRVEGTEASVGAAREQFVPREQPHAGSGDTTLALGVLAVGAYNGVKKLGAGMQDAVKRLGNFFKSGPQ